MQHECVWNCSAHGSWICFLLVFGQQLPTFSLFTGFVDCDKTHIANFILKAAIRINPQELVECPREAVRNHPWTTLQRDVITCLIFSTIFSTGLVTCTAVKQKKNTLNWKVAPFLKKDNLHPLDLRKLMSAKLPQHFFLLLKASLLSWQLTLFPLFFSPVWIVWMSFFYSLCYWWLRTSCVLMQNLTHLTFNAQQTLLWMWS